MQAAGGGADDFAQAVLHVHVNILDAVSRSRPRFRRKSDPVRPTGLAVLRPDDALIHQHSTVGLEALIS